LKCVRSLLDQRLSGAFWYMVDVDLNFLSNTTGDWTVARNSETYVGTGNEKE
jgi:hypothetical protein